MPESSGGAVSSLEEFFHGLAARGVEPDLREALRSRARTASATVERVGDQATVVAVAARLVPGAVPAEVLAGFLDANFDQQLGRGDERMGLLPRADLIPAGFRLLDDEAAKRHGSAFAALAEQQQDALLGDAEGGRLQGGPSGFDGTEWFQRVRDLLLLAYGSDPRGMVEMGFPGPSYETGHVWLDEFEVARRAERAPGYEVL
jgi:hypothetical protein